MENVLNWLVDRIKEKTTWYGIVALVSAVGVTISPDLKEAIATAGIAIAGVIAAITAENK